GPIDATRWAEKARAFRFLVLRMPSTITIRNVAGRLANKDVKSVDVAVAGGRAPELVLNGTSAVNVWPAEGTNEELFENTDPINDKEGKLSPVANIDRVRWLKPGQVQLVSTL